jgi:hypothetical protein
MIIIAAETSRHNIVKTTLTARNGEPRLLRCLTGCCPARSGGVGSAGVRA